VRALLSDLPGFAVIDGGELDDARRVMIMQVAEEYGCPRRGVVIGGKAYDVRESRIKDLAFGERRRSCSGAPMAEVPAGWKLDSRSSRGCREAALPSAASRLCRPPGDRSFREPSGTRRSRSVAG